MPIRVRADTLRLQKAGNLPEDYEDASWPERFVDRHAATFRCAVADGATEASFSGLWARLLVQAYGRGRLREGRLPSSLAPLQRDWLQAVSVRPLPWYAEEKLRSGAFSALVGLTIRHRPSDIDGIARWRAVAVGDSCLFHVRGEELLSSFPLLRGDQFNNAPHLLSSNPARNVDLDRHIVRGSGECLAGDVFFLMTDALACWFLCAVESGERPWCGLTHFDPRCFEEWIGDLRRAGSIRNDDVTLLRVVLG